MHGYQCDCECNHCHCGDSRNFARGTFLIVARLGVPPLDSHARTIIIPLTEDPTRLNPVAPGSLYFLKRLERMATTSDPDIVIWIRRQITMVKSMLDRRDRQNQSVIFNVCVTRRRTDVTHIIIVAQRYTLVVENYRTSANPSWPRSYIMLDC